MDFDETNGGTQTIFSLGRVQTGWILKRLHFNPFCLRNLRSWQPSTSDDNFIVNFSGDVKTWKKAIEEVKTGELGQNNKRR